MPSTPARRPAAGIALAAVIGAGLVVHAVLPDTAATDIAGDALYALAAYTGLVLLFPRLRPLPVAALAGAWCIAVELLQLTGVPLAVGAVFPPAVLLLGAGFDARDLLVYVVAVASAGIADAAAQRRRPPQPAAG